MSIPTIQRAVAAFLAQLAGGPPRETHVSAVFVGAETVWKLKKAVRLDFLDFSEPAQREAMLRRELALNRRTAPELYRDVVAVRRDGAGLALGDGPGEVVDWVLRMAPVPAGDFLDAIAVRHALTPALLAALADAIAAFHATLPPAATLDWEAAMARVADGNARAARTAGLDAARVAAWRADVRREIDTRRAWLTRRASAGFVRRAHGDLHLGNLCLWHGRPVLFDALEFDDALATIDLGYDLAFLLMDLDRRAGRAEANHVLNRYVARTGDAAMAPGCRSISRSGRWCGRMCRQAGATPTRRIISPRPRRICAPRRDRWWPWAACPEPARARSRACWRRRWVPPPAPWCCAAMRHESACSATRRRNGSGPTPTTRRRTRGPTRHCSTCCATPRQARRRSSSMRPASIPDFARPSRRRRRRRAGGSSASGCRRRRTNSSAGLRHARAMRRTRPSPCCAVCERHDPGAGTWRAVAADDGAAALAAAQEYVNSALTAC